MEADVRRNEGERLDGRNWRRVVGQGETYTLTPPAPRRGMALKGEEDRAPLRRRGFGEVGRDAQGGSKRLPCAVQRLK